MDVAPIHVREYIVVIRNIEWTRRTRDASGTPRKSRLDTTSLIELLD